MPKILRLEDKIYAIYHNFMKEYLTITLKFHQEICNKYAIIQVNKPCLELLLRWAISIDVKHKKMFKTLACKII